MLKEQRQVNLPAHRGHGRLVKQELDGMGPVLTASACAGCRPASPVRTLGPRKRGRCRKIGHDEQNHVPDALDQEIPQIKERRS